MLVITAHSKDPATSEFKGRCPVRQLYVDTAAKRLIGELIRVPDKTRPVTHLSSSQFAADIGKLPFAFDPYQSLLKGPAS